MALPQGELFLVLVLVWGHCGNQNIIVWHFYAWWNAEGARSEVRTFARGTWIPNSQQPHHMCINIFHTPTPHPGSRNRRNNFVFDQYNLHDIYITVLLLCCCCGSRTHNRRLRMAFECGGKYVFVVELLPLPYMYVIIMHLHINISFVVEIFICKDCRETAHKTAIWPQLFDGFGHWYLHSARKLFHSWQPLCGGIRLAYFVSCIAKQYVALHCMGCCIWTNMASGAHTTQSPMPGYQIETLIDLTRTKI